MLQGRKMLAVTLAAAVTFGAATTAAADPVELSIASFSHNSVWYAYSARIAELLREGFPEGSVIDAPPKGGGTSNPRLVAAGKFELAFGIAAVTGWAMNGEVVYKEPLTNLRSLLGGFDRQYLLVTARKMPGVDDLPGYIAAKKDMNVVLRGKGSAGGLAGKMLLAMSGAGEDEVAAAGGRYDFVGSFGVVRSAMTSGKSDLWIHTVSKGHPIVTEISLATDLMYLQPSDEVLKKMADNGWPTVVLPAETYKGQSKALKFPGTNSSLFASTEMSDELAYTIVKTICEKQDRFKTVHKALESFDCATRGWQAENVILPLHDGAKRYFVEQGWMK